MLKVIKSLETVADILQSEGFIYRPNRPKIGKANLEHSLKNIFYTGSFKYNGKIYSGLHEPLVSKELFQRVQDAFKKDNKPLYRNEHDFIFAGMLTCAECGCQITAEIKKQKYIYYHCTGWDKTCSQKRIYTKQEKLEKQFDEAVRRISITEEHKNWIIEGLKLSLKDEKEYNEERIKSLEVQAKKLRDRIEKLYIDKLDEKIPESFWIEKDTQWTKELETIETVLKAHKTAGANYLKEGIKTLELCQKAYSLYSNESAEEKAKILKYILSNSILKDGEVSYTYKKPFDIFAKGLSCIKKHPGQDSNL